MKQRTNLIQLILFYLYYKTKPNSGQNVTEDLQVVVDNSIYKGLERVRYRRSGVRSQAIITEATATLALGVSASTTPGSNSTLNDCCYIDKSNSKCSNYKQSLRTGLGETLLT